MELSVIIVSYNVKYFLEQCLCSLTATLRGIDAEVIVVDNCSGDDTVAYLENRYPAVVFIKNASNLGFARANNIGLRQCRGKYVLFLNPDTLVPENLIRSCLDFLSGHPEAGSVGVRMVDGAGRFLPESKRSFPSPFSAFYKLSGLSAMFPRSRHFNRYALGHLAEDAITEVQVLSGAFLMARTGLLLQVEGFDEAFFMYGEDIDLCFRLHQTGFRQYYLGNMTIVHFKGESSRQDKRRHNRMFYDAMKIFVAKHYGRRGGFFQALLYAGIIGRAAVSRFEGIFAGKSSQAMHAHSAGISFCLVGDPLGGTEAEEILQKNGGTLAKKLQSVRSLEDSAGVATDIVFCAGSLSYKAGIDFINGHPGLYRYWWHGRDTRCIVGSSDRKATGIVFHS